MSLFENVTPELLNPPAYVQVMFDEARAVAECRALIERRDEAKGEFKDAILAIGQKLIEARRAMPDVAQPYGRGRGRLSEAFKAFVAKTGIAVGTAKQYMGYARHPRSLERSRERMNTRRVKISTVISLIDAGATIEDLRAALQEELNVRTA